MDLKITYQYSKGEVPHEDAVVRLRKAAKQGDALAQNVLGRCYSLQGNAEEKELMPCVNLVAKAIRREWDKEVFLRKIPGLSASFVQQFPTLPIAMDPVASVGE